MRMQAVPDALRARLGAEATRGLVELFDRFRPEVAEHVIAVCAERFERRLAEECAGVRVQIAHADTSLRREIVEARAGVRQEMTDMRAELRQEMTGMGAQLRQEMTGMGAHLQQQITVMRAELGQEISRMGAELRQEMASGRLDLIKWCFIFWIGQALTIAGILGVMVRVYRP